jgi:predicted amidohydrolase
VKVAVAQIAPVFLDREATLAKITRAVGDAADQGAKLVAFGETLLPAYPVWLSKTGGAAFNDPGQKRIHAEYLAQAVTIEKGHLAPICDASKARDVTVVVGVAERPLERAQSIYCSRVIIQNGAIASVHRKLMPTYEERLAWGIGDGAGLRTHPLGDFTLSSLNCWENWMPLARAALYAQGADLHVALWPGCERLTRDITRFIALESRSYVISASAVIREQDLPPDVPMRDRIARSGETIYDGGSCIAAPDGSWLIEPLTEREEIILADLDQAKVREERQNFDPAGHYARPDVFHLAVDRRRQTPADFVDGQVNPRVARRENDGDA